MLFLTDNNPVVSIEHHAIFFIFREKNNYILTALSHMGRHGVGTFWPSQVVLAAGTTERSDILLTGLPYLMLKDDANLHLGS